MVERYGTSRAERRGLCAAGVDDMVVNVDSRMAPAARRSRALVEDTSETDKRAREQSAISFPYVDLYAAVEIARAIYNRCGDDVCDLNDLASDLDDSAGGAFRLKTSAARIFDLIEKRGRSEARLTRSGMRVVTQDDVTAKAQAFLKVPLYSAVYQRFKNSHLPPKKSLEQELKKLGVPEKQVDKARQVLERSARQAGFLDESDNKLVRPVEDQPQIGNKSQIARASMMDTENRFEIYAAQAGISASLRRDDPLIVGLVERLPALGSPWSDEARVAWLRLATSIFDVAYTDGTGKIEISMNIETEDEGR